MTKVVRTLLLWMMLFALPVQGMAQASMFACHLQGDSSAESVSMLNHSDMDHGSMDHSMHATDDTDPDSAKKLMKSLHGCCNCAPTCAVVLLPVAQASFGAVQHDILHPISAPQIPHSADTRRIDRPPKTLAI
ncbi:hypothetical protein [Limnobacter parvus]|uniref:DUF2946 domain-containing protein n=1 Tax=Limnobacter parvus TaxID=2939690 RepID=A0ABT1XK26_9BURK|nr:hypothetical protein [Limnobacter parvus]MCR2747211.1 hypothetical protein [Limnobacter parvus]